MTHLFIESREADCLDAMLAYSKALSDARVDNLSGAVCTRKRDETTGYLLSTDKSFLCFECHFKCSEEEAMRIIDEAWIHAVVEVSACIRITRS